MHEGTPAHKQIICNNEALVFSSRIVLGLFLDLGLRVSFSVLGLGFELQFGLE